MAKVSAWDLFVNTNGLLPVSQMEVDQAIVEMEARGFLLDVEFCRSQAKVVEVDERKQIEELNHWIDTVPYTVVKSVEDKWFLFGSRRDGRKWKTKKFAISRPPTSLEEVEGREKFWSSPTKLRYFIHDDPKGLCLPYSPIWKKGKVKLDKGEVKLDEVALDWLMMKFPQYKAGLKMLINLRRVRGCKKYLNKLPLYISPDGRVHPVCGPAGDEDGRVGAVTGRLAMKNPEGQQIPRDKKKDPYRIRKAIIAGPGNILVVADYSALEVVILAHLCKVLFGDTQLEDMVKPGAPDIHSVNAKNIFGTLLGWKVEDGAGWPDVGKPVAEFELYHFKNDADESKCHPYAKYLRDQVKRVWYGLQYGKGGYGFGNSLLDADGNPIGEEKATAIVEALLTSIPALRKYQEWVRKHIKHANGIPGLDGRFCDLSAKTTTKEKQDFERAWRQALNFPMQNGGAGIIGAAMVLVNRDPVLRELGFYIILQVHDELVLEGPAENGDAAIVRVSQIMVECFFLMVALQVTAHKGKNWNDAK